MMSPHALVDASAAIGLALVLVMAAALITAGGARRGRKAAVVALVVVFVFFGFEAAVHQVHHLSDPDAAASCPVLVGSHHAPAVCTETSPIAMPLLTAVPAPTIHAPLLRSLQRFRAHPDRAPPSLPAA